MPLKKDAIGFKLNGLNFIQYGEKTVCNTIFVYFLTSPCVWHTADATICLVMSELLRSIVSYLRLISSIYGKTIRFATSYTNVTDTCEQNVSIFTSYMRS